MEVPTPETTKNADDLRNAGNGLFKEGNYLDAIKKYEEAIRAGKGDQDNKAKCYRLNVIFYKKLL